MQALAKTSHESIRGEKFSLKNWNYIKVICQNEVVFKWK